MKDSKKEFKRASSILSATRPDLCILDSFHRKIRIDNIGGSTSKKKTASSTIAGGDLT